MEYSLPSRFGEYLSLEPSEIPGHNQVENKLQNVDCYDDLVDNWQQTNQP